MLSCLCHSNQQTTTLRKPKSVWDQDTFTCVGSDIWLFSSLIWRKTTRRWRCLGLISGLNYYLCLVLKHLFKLIYRHQLTHLETMETARSSISAPPTTRDSFVRSLISIVDWYFSAHWRPRQAVSGTYLASVQQENRNNSSLKIRDYQTLNKKRVTLRQLFGLSPVNISFQGTSRNKTHYFRPQRLTAWLQLLGSFSVSSCSCRLMPEV